MAVAARRVADGGGGAALTPRKREVVELVARGLTNEEIARSLGVSPLTVKKHLECMYAALEVANRAELVARTWRVPSGGPQSGIPRHNLPAALAGDAAASAVVRVKALNAAGNMGRSAGDYWAPGRRDDDRP